MALKRLTTAKHIDFSHISKETENNDIKNEQ